MSKIKLTRSKSLYRSLIAHFVRFVKRPSIKILYFGEQNYKYFVFWRNKKKECHHISFLWKFFSNFFKKEKKQKKEVYIYYRTIRITIF